jgi:HPt (histidine-containing phosphotransfer) domain-containing protein
VDIFDREEFSDNLMGNEDLARQIIRRFLDDLPTEICKLAQAVNDGDTGQVRLTAHSIKGAAASVSGREIRDAASLLEQQGRDGDLTEANAVLVQLSASFERAKPLMEGFCREDAALT